MKINRIAKELLIWYADNKRDLPWRIDRNPYKIWLSEVILQQTRVDQGLPYYLKFVEKYPSVDDLASAKEDDVLRTWQGLGYYSRARNLHKCAKTIVEKYHGSFPSTKVELMQLPGVGPYTSAAIASIAFGKKEAVIDGNVLRVITRIYGIYDDISKQKTQKEIKTIVDELIPTSQPDQFNQAIMEFGALQCTPKNPGCDICSFRGICGAQINGSQMKIPFNSKKIQKRKRFFNYFIIRINGSYLMRKRVKKDIWNGLFEFYLIETKSANEIGQMQLPAALVNQSMNWKINGESIEVKHILTHQRIMARFYNISVSKEFEYNSTDWEDYQLYSKEEIENLPKSILIDRYWEKK